MSNEIDILGGKTDLLQGVMDAGAFFLPQAKSKLAAKSGLDFSGFSKAEIVTGNSFANDGKWTLNDLFKDLPFDASGIFTAGGPEIANLEGIDKGAGRSGLASVSDLLETLIARIAVIILGLIFVAIGLSMFKSGQTIIAAAKGV